MIPTRPRLFLVAAGKGRIAASAAKLVQDIMSLKRLILGPSKRPSRLVAMFHGLGGNRYEQLPTTERWSDALPSTAFLLLEAADKDYHGRELLTGAFSGDWYPFPGLRSQFGDDESAYTGMVLGCISRSCDRVSRELDDYLEHIDLDDSQLILAGFSQGAAISAYTGLQRRCLGVLPFGGPCPPRRALLPDDNNTTRVCVVVGDADHCVRHEELTHEFSKYRRQDEVTDGVHVIPGQGHTVSATSEALGLAFLRSCGCR